MQQMAATSELVARLASERTQQEAHAPHGGGGVDHRLKHHVPLNRPMGHRQRQEDEAPNHRSPLPKLSFPKFTGENSRISVDKCTDYFRIFSIPECRWTTSAFLHMEENATKWLQMYKMRKGLGDWSEFVCDVEQKFGAYDYMRAVHDLLALHQEGSVEDYTREFEALQFQVAMYNTRYDDMFFTSHFVNCLKEEIRGSVQSQLPESVDRASLLAKIHQHILDRQKSKHTKVHNAKGASAFVKQETPQ
jgi:hypothetical protein